MVVPVAGRPAIGLRRAVGRRTPTSAPPTPTTTDRSTTRSALQTTSTTCLNAVNRALVDPLTEDDVVGTWAGLRPLVARRRRTSAPPTSRAATASAYRGARRGHDHRRQAHHVPRHGRGHHRPGRPAARRPAPTLPHQAPAAHRRGRVPRTARRWLDGGRPPRRAATAPRPSVVQGTHRRAIPTLGEPLVPGLPYVRAEAVFAVRSEMARTLDDVLDRRTRARMLDRDATWTAAEAVARLLAPELGWDDDDRHPGGRRVPSRARARARPAAAPSCVRSGCP